MPTILPPSPSPGVSTIVLTFGVMALLALVELAIPLHTRGRWHRAHLAPNLALTAITFATGLLLHGVLGLALARLERAGFGLLRWASLGSLAAGVIAVVALDLATYLAHVAMHRSRALWRFHRVHHSDPALDVTTTIRQHPVESLVRYGFIVVFACLLGVDVGAFAIYRTLSVLCGLLEHANVRVPRWLDATLSLITTWPSFHKVHHSRDVRETDTNYGNILSLFDRLFGTHTPAWRGATVVTGLDGFDDPASQTTKGLLVMPYRELSVSHSTDDPCRPSA